MSIPILLILAALVLASCAPAAETATAPPTVEAPTATATTEPGDDSATAVETPEVEQGFPIEPGKNVLALIRGEARITHDDGNSWTATGTGQYVEEGDEIQLTSDGLALLFLFNGAVVRLEGATDFQLQRADKEDETGATQITARLWEGYAMFETNPLPTPDSLFQFYAMTSFIHVDYDADLAQAVEGSLELDPQRTIIAGGSLTDEDESLYVYRGPATIYVIGWDNADQDYVADVYPSQQEQAMLLELDFLADPRLEADIEGFIDIAGTLIHQYATGEQLGQGILGYSLEDVETLESGATRFFFLTDPLAIGHGESFVDGEDRVTVVVTAQALYAAGGPLVLDVEVMILAGNTFGFGCNPETGMGCAAPQGCNLDTGEGCSLESGCNLVTRDGCRQTHVSCKVELQGDNLGNVLDAALICPEAQQLQCDPNLSGDCDRFYDASSWVGRDEVDEEWC